MRFDPHALAWIARIAVQHRVGERFRQANPEVEAEALTTEADLLAAVDQVTDRAIDRAEIVG